MANVRLGSTDRILRCGLVLLGSLTAGCMRSESDAPDPSGEHASAVAPAVVAGAGSDAGAGGCPVACMINVWINPSLDPALDVAMSNRVNIFQNAVMAWNTALNTLCKGRALPRLNYVGQSNNYAIAYPVPPNMAAPETIWVNGVAVVTGKTVFTAMGTMRPNQVASTAPGQAVNTGGMPAPAPAGDGYIGKGTLGVGSNIAVDAVLADQTGGRPNSANIVWYTHYLGTLPNPSTRIGWDYGSGTVSGISPGSGTIPFLNIMEHELGHVLGAPDQNQGIMNGFFNPNLVNNPQITQNDVDAVPAGCN